MEIKSLGFRSELIFLEFDGEVLDRGEYTVVRTLTNPGFYWGNLLIFDRAPVKGDYAKWVATFDREFADPRIKHKTFAWDSLASEIGDVAEFEANNFKLEKNAVLSAKANEIYRPQKYNSAIEIRQLKSGAEPQAESDWYQNIELQTRTGEPHLTEAQWRDFSTQQSHRYREMIKAGRGAWFGAFLNNELVASLGLFHSNGVGRYQIVVTDENHRRQGIAATLVYEAAKYAFQNWNVQDLVMCADPDYFAIRIYESVGFKQTLTQHGVYWWEGKPRA